MIENKILTKKAMEIINKKLENQKLTQQDSNYLSRFVRPKLRDIASINAEVLLRKLEYNPRALSIERRIKNIILKNVPKVDSIIVCGSAIQTNYKEYNDLDVIVATRNVLTKSLKEKNKLIKKIGEIGKSENLNLDVQIYARNSILSQYVHNPSLIYQLKDSKIIYGKLNLPSKVNISNLDLKMKLDWSEGLHIYSNASEIYYALRNAMLVLMLINKKIDNSQLRENLISILGGDLVVKLMKNQASKEEKKLALNYLNSLIRYLETELNNPKWEKIEIENP
ncbi:MAG: nucleotidyltransferase domain-containing protein [archaeon]